MNEKKVEDHKFNFRYLHEIDINFTNSLEFFPELKNCSKQDSEYGFEIYVICLKNGILPDNSSLLYYNNYSTIDKSIAGDYGTMYADYPDYDRSFEINPELIDKMYDEIIFLIGRPKSYVSKNEEWIHQDLVKDVIEDFCFVECKLLFADQIHSCISISKIKYEYNKFGAMVLFSLKKNNNQWNLNLKNKTYTNGLFQIVVKHNKMHT